VLLQLLDRQTWELRLNGHGGGHQGGRGLFFRPAANWTSDNPAIPTRESAARSRRVTNTIRDHRFEPSEIHAPAGKRIMLTVVNADPLSEEFDSAALKQVIAGRSEGTVRLRPLDPGRYPFIGEYHADTAQGVLIAE
jgi:Cupredoxin-like domain